MERLVGSTIGAQPPQPPAAIFEKPRQHNAEAVHETPEWADREPTPMRLSRQPLEMDLGVDINLASGFVVV